MDENEIDKKRNIQTGILLFQKLRTHWAGIKEHVSSFDELDMATTRLRVRLPDEPKPDTPQMNVLEPSEVCFFLSEPVHDKTFSMGF